MFSGTISISADAIINSFDDHDLNEVRNHSECVANSKRSSDGRTPLHVAIDGRHLEAAKVLLEEMGADPSITDKKGRTALHAAAEKKCVAASFIALIVEKSGEDSHGQQRTIVDALDNEGRTALHVAIENDNVDTAIMLLNTFGASVSLKTRFKRQNALHCALGNRLNGCDARQHVGTLHCGRDNNLSVDFVRSLASNAVRFVDEKDARGRTALDHAIQNQYFVAAFILLKDYDAAFTDEHEAVVPLARPLLASEATSMRGAVREGCCGLSLTKQQDGQLGGTVLHRIIEGCLSLIEDSHLCYFSSLSGRDDSSTAIEGSDDSFSSPFSFDFPIDLIRFIGQKGGVSFVNTPSGGGRGQTVLHTLAETSIKMMMHLAIACAHQKMNSEADSSEHSECDWADGLLQRFRSACFELFHILVEELGADASLEDAEGLTALDIILFEKPISICVHFALTPHLHRDFSGQSNLSSAVSVRSAPSPVTFSSPSYVSSTLPSCASRQRCHQISRFSIFFFHLSHPISVLLSSTSRFVRSRCDKHIFW